jgi:hypothetical protein
MTGGFQAQSSKTEGLISYKFEIFMEIANKCDIIIPDSLNYMSLLDSLRPITTSIRSTSSAQPPQEQRQAVEPGLGQFISRDQPIPKWMPPAVSPAAINMSATPVAAPQAMVPTSMPFTQTPTAALDALVESVQQASSDPAAEASLKALRVQLFGDYHRDLEGRVAEMRSAMDQSLAFARHAMMERVDELGGVLQRDMMALRQEIHSELEDLKRDVFTTVMSLSAIHDKISVTDSRNRETWVAVTKALNERIEQQQQVQQSSLENFRQGIDFALQGRVASLVESTLLNRAINRMNSQPEGAGPQPTMPLMTGSLHNALPYQPSATQPLTSQDAISVMARTSLPIRPNL